MTTSKLQLPQVTLCCLGSEAYRETQQKALDYSSQFIEFGAVKNIIHECKGIDAWNRAIVFDLGGYIDTPFALLIHPDGYVVHPESWNDDWLQYDYIGAPWELPTDSFSYRDKYGKIQRVGNSVSLRSKNLMDLPKKLEMPWKAFHGFTNEDGYICVNMRHLFEEFGCKFAPIEVAKYFSRERDIPENEDVDKPFAFHGITGKNKEYMSFEQ